MNILTANYPRKFSIGISEIVSRDEFVKKLIQYSSFAKSIFVGIFILSFIQLDFL